MIDWMPNASRNIVAFDLDGTLAQSIGNDYKDPAHIGPPIAPMVAALCKCLKAGYDVVIFTARVDPQRPEYAAAATAAIKRWCLRHIGREFPVTAIKSFQMVAFYDDKAIQIVPNTGKRVDGHDGEIPT